jgi:hypothetical protein
LRLQHRIGDEAHQLQYRVLEGIDPIRLMVYNIYGRGAQAIL